MPHTPTPQLILVVDDEPTIREVIRRYLERDGFRVREAEDGFSALQAVQEEPPDLIVLDLMLPGIDGLTITRQLRQRHSIPIIMLTARGETSDRIRGLELGADDYVAKPFSPQEVVARVQAVLRRASGSLQNHDAPLELGGLQIDPQARSVTQAGKLIPLTAKEFDLLYLLASHPRQVFTRSQLLDQVWGSHFEGDPSTVTVHIRRLREKVEADASNPQFLITVWGVGYKFEA
ncbi:MAG TPA: response regulator transcription factor [Anaerolineales bacterium]|nr:response regulator transcription factor [Anaerolineales bacterium]